MGWKVKNDQIIGRFVRWRCLALTLLLDAFYYGGLISSWLSLG